MSIVDMVQYMGFIYMDCLLWVLNNPLGQCFLAFGFVLCSIRIGLYLFGA